MFLSAGLGQPARTPGNKWETIAGIRLGWETTGRNGPQTGDNKVVASPTQLEVNRPDRGVQPKPAAAIATAERRSATCVDPLGSTAVFKQGETAPDVNPRLVTGPVALRYLCGERPERFGVEAIQGKRQRLYDRCAIDAALDRIAGLASLAKADSTQDDPLVTLAEEWR